jgi:hypothetical protein
LSVPLSLRISSGALDTARRVIPDFETRKSQEQSFFMEALKKETDES